MQAQREDDDSHSVNTELPEHILNTVFFSSASSTHKWVCADGTSGDATQRHCHVLFGRWFTYEEYHRFRCSLQEIDILKQWKSPYILETADKQVASMDMTICSHMFITEIVCLTKDPRVHGHIQQFASLLGLMTSQTMALLTQLVQERRVAYLKNSSLDQAHKRYCSNFGQQKLFRSRESYPFIHNREGSAVHHYHTAEMQAVFASWSGQEGQECLDI